MEPPALKDLQRIEPESCMLGADPGTMRRPGDLRALWSQQSSIFYMSPNHLERCSSITIFSYNVFDSFETVQSSEIWRDVFYNFCSKKVAVV